MYICIPQCYWGGIIFPIGYSLLAIPGLYRVEMLLLLNCRLHWPLLFPCGSNRPCYALVDPKAPLIPLWIQ